jgi:hypothetical protein
VGDFFVPAFFFVAIAHPSKTKAECLYLVYQQGNPAFLTDPWLSVPASQQVWLLVDQVLKNSSYFQYFEDTCYSQNYLFIISKWNMSQFIHTAMRLQQGSQCRNLTNRDIEPLAFHNEIY